MKILGIVAVDVVRESRKFSGHPYVGRIAVIFAMAQLSCLLCITRFLELCQPQMIFGRFVRYYACMQLLSLTGPVWKAV